MSATTGSPGRGRRVQVDEPQSSANPSCSARLLADIPSTKVFCPTPAEFSNPCAYIASIRREAEQYGVVIVRPPAGWYPPSRWPALQTSAFKHVVTCQMLNQLTDGYDFEYGKTYTAAAYKTKADKFKNERFPEFAHPVLDGGSSAPRPRSGRARTVEAATAPEAVAHESGGYPLRGTTASIIAGAPAIEAAYWDIVESGPDREGGDVFVEYANDQDTRQCGSGFLTRAVPSPFHVADGRDWAPPAAETPVDFFSPDYYASCGWNLNNLPFLPDSLLRHVPEEVNGLNVPWLYYGSLFATFSWHNEDNWAYSINYMHEGEGKVWYATPSTAADAFEDFVLDQKKEKIAQRAAAKEAEAVASESASSSLAPLPLPPGSPPGAACRAVKQVAQKVDKRDPLYTITMMVAPHALKAAGVPVFRVIQCPGDFVLTFPRAYHAGFSLGWTMAEAVNFATADWLPWGEAAVARYADTTRLAQRAPAFPHEQLLVMMAKQARYIANDALLPLLTQLFRTLSLERTDRAALYGASQASHAASPRTGSSGPEAVRIASDQDDRSECLRCKRVCYLSCLVCDRCPTANRKIACLQHGADLCKCAPNTRVLAYWWPLADLEQLVHTVFSEAVARRLPGAEEFRLRLLPSGSGSSAGMHTEMHQTARVPVSSASTMTASPRSLDHSPAVHAGLVGADPALGTSKIGARGSCSSFGSGRRSRTDATDASSATARGSSSALSPVGGMQSKRQRKQ